MDEEEVESFRVVDDTLQDTFESVTAAASLDDVPPTISSDPVFQEIIQSVGSEDTEKSKRGFRAYDPRHSAIYAHKYQDANSQWYYFRKGY